VVGWVSTHDIGQAGLLQHLHATVVRGICIRLRIPSCIRAPPAAENSTSGRLQLDRAFAGGDDRVADIHPHRPAHEGEILRRRDDGRAPDLALGDQHRLALAGGLLRGAHPVGVFLLVAELQRVGHRLGHRHLGEDRRRRTAP
jgi:hypothetical protein